MKYLKHLIIAGAMFILTSCGQSSLSGKYQSETRNNGFEFLPDNNVVIRVPGNSDGTAAKYEILNGDKLKLTTPVGYQIFDVEFKDDSLIIKTSAYNGVYRKVDEFSWANAQSATILAQQSARASIEGKRQIRLMNSFQVSYHTQYPKFASNYQDLAMGPPPETANYRFQIVPQGDMTKSVMMTATAKIPGLESYIGLVFYDTVNHIITQICQTQQPLTTPPAMPPAPTDPSQPIQCPPGSIPVQ